MKEHNYYVYILTNSWDTVFYTGVTNDLVRRVFEHTMQMIEGFIKRYNVNKLVYFEHTTDVQAALHREKIIKKWKRTFKLDAINRMNPNWHDLYSEMTGEPDYCHAALVAASSAMEGDPAISAG